jgi:phospholipid/cholesterol/gamma-HCH transport system substrate-binding protein
MKESTRNLLVGLTVVLALGILGGMIIAFRELPSFMQTGYAVRIHMSDTGGAIVGADVLIAGKRVGHVTDIAFADQRDLTQGVIMAAAIDTGIPIPANFRAYVHNRGLTGGAVIDLRAPDGQLSTGSYLPTHGKPTRQGELSGDTGLIPREMLSDLRVALASVRRLADNVNSIMAAPDTPEYAAMFPATAPGSTTGPATQPAPRRANLHNTVARLDQAMDNLNMIIGDQENQRNVVATLKNLAAASEAAKAVMAQAQDVLAQVSGATKVAAQAVGSAGKHIDDLAPKLMDSVDKLSAVLTSLHNVAVKMESGEGTAGKLMNDPALYNNLQDVTAQLKTTLESTQQMLDEWKKNGIPM